MAQAFIDKIHQKDQRLIFSEADVRTMIDFTERRGVFFSIWDAPLQYSLATSPPAAQLSDISLQYTSPVLIESRLRAPRSLIALLQRRSRAERVSSDDQ